MTTAIHKHDGADWAYAPTSITIETFYQRLYSDGVRVVQRYLWDGGKGVTPREQVAAKAAGIRIAYGYEGYATNWRGGAAQGAIDGARARALAVKLGLPKGTPIYYAVDEDAYGLGMLSTALAYVRAADHPDYPARPYGGYDVVQAYGQPGFQASAWSRGLISGHTALYQWHNSQPLAGGIVDLDEIRDADALGLTPSAGGRTVYDDAAIDGKIKHLQDQLDNIGRHITGHTARLHDIDGHLGKLDAVATTLDGLVADFRAFHRNMFDHIGGLQKQLNDQGARLTALGSPAPAHPSPGPQHAAEAQQ